MTSKCFRRLARIITLTLIAALVAFSFVFPAQSFAQQNRLFASVSGFTGSTSAPRFVAEVDIATRSVSELFSVPVPPNNSFSFDQARDLVVDQDGNVLLYNGTFTPSLLSGNATDGVVDQLQFAGLSTINNTTFGGIAREGNFVYLTDQRTGGAPEQGIVRVNLEDNSFIRFAETIEPSDLNIGPDGVVFAIDGAGSPTNTVFRYDLETTELINEVRVAFAGHRAVAGLADGTFFTATSSGDIFHYDLDGSLLNSANVSGAFFADIDIAPDGQIALGTAGSGEVVLTDTTLRSFERFRITESSVGGNTFVAFATDFSAVPEPASGLILIPFGMLYSLRRKKS